MTLLSQFFEFAGASGKQLRFNPTVGLSPVVGQGIAGEPESGRGERGKGGEGEIGWKLFLV